MADLKTPFRYDYVGSFLRPEALKQARKNFEEGKITKEELTAVEDDCIRDLVGKIKKLGYHVITDGEFRRSTWHLDFMWGFQGIEHRKTVEGNTTFDAEAAMIDDTYMVGKISVKNHPFVEHFKFVKALEDESRLFRLQDSFMLTLQVPSFLELHWISMEVKKLLQKMWQGHMWNLSMRSTQQAAATFSLMTVYGAVWLIQNWQLH